MKLFPFNIKIGALDQFSKTFANVSSKMDRLGKKATRVGKAISLGVSAPLAGFGFLAVKTTASFETLRTALETATGSAEAAAAEFAKLQHFAATTPFQLEEVVSAFIKLKNLGLDPSEAALTSYGNTAGAMGKSLDQMIEAVADASTFEFERLKEFGIKANQQGNKVTFTFRGVKTTVRKDAAEITKYLRKIGDEQFAGGMDKQARTIAGAFSNLQDGISSSLDIIGADIAKTFDLNARVRGLTDKITGLANAFNSLPRPIKEMVINTGLFLVVLGPVITGVGQLIIGMGIMVALAPQIAAGFALITAAAPWLLLGGLVLGIGIMFMKLVRQVGGFKNAIILLGTTVVDVLLSPFRLLANIVEKIWGLFGNPPEALKTIGTPLTRIVGQDMAAKAEEGRSVAAMRNTYEIQQRALKGDKAAIEILFKNPPPGMRTQVTDGNANVSLEQGVSMAGAY